MKGGMVMKFLKKVNIITKQWTLLSNKVQELKRIGSDCEIYVS
jgi:hypothetical protein